MVIVFQQTLCQRDLNGKFTDTKPGNKTVKLSELTESLLITE